MALVAEGCRSIAHPLNSLATSICCLAWSPHLGPGNEARRVPLYGELTIASFSACFFKQFQAGFAVGSGYICLFCKDW